MTNPNNRLSFLDRYRQFNDELERKQECTRKSGEYSLAALTEQLRQWRENAARKKDTR